MSNHAETIINIIRQDMTKSDEEKAQLIEFLNSNDKFKKSTVPYLFNIKGHLNIK